MSAFFSLFEAGKELRLYAKTTPNNDANDVPSTVTATISPSFWYIRYCDCCAKSIILTALTCFCVSIPIALSINGSTMPWLIKPRRAPEIAPEKKSYCNKGECSQLSITSKNHFSLGYRINDMGILLRVLNHD
jgi:hypothetical protein